VNTGCKLLSAPFHDTRSRLPLEQVAWPIVHKQQYTSSRPLEINVDTRGWCTDATAMVLDNYALMMTTMIWRCYKTFCEKFRDKIYFAWTWDTGGQFGIVHQANPGQLATLREQQIQSLHHHTSLISYGEYTVHDIISWVVYVITSSSSSSRTLFNATISWVSLFLALKTVPYVPDKHSTMTAVQSTVI